MFNSKSKIQFYLKIYYMKGLKIIVLAKQVPDTRNVGKDAMTEAGTVNRAALPAIFNPEDLNALEQALRIKEQVPGTEITMLTMGPGRASEILREGMFRGADGGVLLTDRAFAGADTLATSYALSCAIRSIGEFDLIIGGRQAIDGDTAQVGPQVAEKLGIPQITYAEEVVKIDEKTITVKRRLEHGTEVVAGAMPLLITVNGSAAPCRPRNAKRVMKFKNAATPSERTANPKLAEVAEGRPYLDIKEWGVANITCEAEQLGMSGSPTKVKNVMNIVFQAKESKVLGDTDNEINDLMQELISNHTIG